MDRDQVWWTAWDYRSHERCAPGEPWWFDNRKRSASGGVTLQTIHQGSIRLRDAGGTCEVGPGQAFLFAWGEDSDYGRPADLPDWPGHRDALVTSFVSLRGAGLHEHWRSLIARWGRMVTLPPGAESRLFHLGRTADARLVPALTAARATADLVADVAEVWAEAHQDRRSPVQTAIALLHADPWGDRPLKALAASCGCSREHLTRLFTAHYGLPPAVWQRQQRLQRAVELLRNTDLSISEITTRSGAGSFHRLARWTRAAYGLPPEQARVHLRTLADID